MSDVILTNRLTGNTFMNSAVIHVIAQTGSIVNLEKNGVILKTLTLSESHSNNKPGNYSDYYFLIQPSQYGTYTISATYEDFAAEEILDINNNEQYDLDLKYIKYLYRAGDEFIDYTGGWIGSNSTGWSGAHSVPSITRYSDRMNVIYSCSGKIRTKNLINIDELASITIKFIPRATFYQNFYVGIYDTDTRLNLSRISTVAINNESIQTFDVSSWTGNHHIALVAWNDNSENIDFYEIYVTKKIV